MSDQPPPGPAPEDTSTPLVRQQFATDSTAEAQHFLRTVYAANDARLFGTPHDFRFEGGFLRSSRLSLEYLDISEGGHITFEPLRAVVVVQVVRGHLILHSGGIRENLSAGHMALLGPNAEVDAEWRDVRLALTRLDADTLQRVATTNTEGRFDLDLALSRPVGQRQAAHLRATIDHVRRDVYSNTAAVASDLVRRQAFGLLAAAVLTTFRSAYLDSQPHLDTRGLAASSVVRRACAYMEAHADERIDQADVVRAARVSARTLQSAFQRYLETTPTAYLIGVRLARARDDLLRMDRTRGDTVAQVAERWHFSNGGRFARLYLQKYGQSPHDTLMM